MRIIQIKNCERCNKPYRYKFAIKDDYDGKHILQGYHDYDVNYNPILCTDCSNNIITNYN